MHRMRILLVNHTFPPASFAGSEICVLNQAKELQRRGHEAAVFYRIHDPSKEEYALETGEWKGVPVYILNHTYRFVRTFQEIYVNSAIAVRFAYALAQWKPDLVHFHHLTNLSLSLIDEVKARKIPAVMTLHDYWLLCQRGQMLKRDLSLCVEPSIENCRACLAPQLLRGRLQRFVSVLWKKGRKTSNASRDEIHLTDLHKARIQTADRRFVALASFDMGDRPGETLQAHPPATIAYPFKSEKPMVLETSIGMHPSTYSQEGQGVCFQVLLNNEILFTRTLNPKQNIDDRGWHAIRVELPPSSLKIGELILRTLPEMENDNRFCTAGWRKPVVRTEESGTTIRPPEPARHREIRNLLHQIVEQITGLVTAFSVRANEAILHRANWVRRVWDRTDLFISPSLFLRDFFIQHGLPENKIIFLDNGFDASPPPNPEFPHQPIRFGYIGTWIPSKGVDLVLQAFQTVNPRKARLIVHGFFPGYDGFDDYESRLRSLASPAVEWGGKYKPEEIFDRLAEIDCLIMPSIWWENSPLTIHEAFLAHVPVITSNVGGMAEQVRLGGGLTFQHRDADNLRDTIQRLIDAPQILDGLRRSIPGVQSLSGHVDRLEEIYTNLIKNKMNENEHGRYGL